MKESIMVFMKDYKDLMACNKAFYKKHWKGTIVVNYLVFSGFVIGMYAGEELERYIHNRKEQKKKQKCAE